MRKMLETIEKALVLANRTQPGWDADQELHDYLSEIVIKLMALKAGDYMIVPSMWTTTADRKGNAVLYIVHRRDTCCSFAICNTGQGLQHHPYCLKPDKSATLLYQRVLVVDDVPMSKVFDTAFWLLVMRFQVRGKERQNML